MLLNDTLPKYHEQVLGNHKENRGFTTGKTVIAVPLYSAVRRRTAKDSLPCDRNRAHGKEIEHGKGATQRTAMRSARQRGGTAHGNEHQHGEERTKRTAKTIARQRLVTAHGKERTHGKGPFAVRHPFAVRKQVFSFFFHFCFILFTTYVYFSVSFIFC
jgi:hypothetical protein